MLKDIYNIYQRNIKLLDRLDKIIYYLRTQNFDYALRIATTEINELNTFVNLIINNLDYFNDEVLEIQVEYIMDVLQFLLNAQENKDYILIADLYEVQLSPLLLKIQEVIMKREGIIIDNEVYKNNQKILEHHDKDLFIKIDTTTSLLENLDDRYKIEYTSSGLFTIAIEDGKKRYYMHSNNNVANEAFTLANSWYKEDKLNYVIYGLGLGYHVKELFAIDTNINIEVYESDINVIQLACALSNVCYIFNHTNVKLIFDPDFKKLSKRLNALEDNEDELVVHYPSLRNIKSDPIREKMENYFIEYSSIKNQLRLLNGNFRTNINLHDGIIDELRDKFMGKDLYIVAAGPSLDKNYMKIKNIGENSIILATGTVLRKLIHVGIKPDYFIVTDANERVYTQISGFENEMIPMLFLATAYKGFALKYQGKKYLILQHDYTKSEEYALLNGHNLYKTGGSVTTTALDIGISLGCKRIIFLGLDLAFTDNYVHALGTSSRELTHTEDLRQVEDINGNLIYTSKSLDMYRQWIENRIKGISEIEFIDATEGGAKIRGTRIAKLDDII